MPSHKSINLQLRIDKPDNVYRFIYAWKVIPSSHGKSINYILLHGILQWENCSSPHNSFSIAIQYSDQPGESVDISQPPHILEKDVQQVNAEFTTFIQDRNGKK